ncbi:MAG: TIM barrel protein [Anaerolineaceae bacterium]|jgi:sugar phosphate isomerase/epimerase
MTENIQIGFNIHPRWAAGSTLETFLAPLKAAGLSALEFALEGHDPDWKAFEPLMDEGASQGYHLCFHAPFRAPYTLAGFKGNDRDAIIALYRPMLAIAQSWAMRQGGQATVVLHSAHSDHAERAALYADTLSFLEWALQEFDHLRIAVENLGPSSGADVKVGDTREEVLSLVTSLDHPRLGTCWDFGHDCLHHRTHLPPEEWLRRVVHVHAHDLDAAGLDHYPLVFGNCPYQAWLQAVACSGMRGVATLEVKGGQMKGWSLERVTKALVDSIKDLKEASTCLTQ